MKSVLLKMILMSALSLGLSSLQAEWEPAYCLPDDDLTGLDNPEFKKLKVSVEQELEKSWCSKEKINLLMDLVCVTKPQVCVDIGACTGSSVLPVAAALKMNRRGKVFAVDAWSNEVVTRYLDQDDPNRAWWSQVDMQAVLSAFRSMVKTYGFELCCTEMKMSSLEAANQLQQIDFINFDGDYSEKGSVADVEALLPRVKKGGYILLSNLFIMVKGKAPKMKAFSLLFDSCEMICEIERDHAVLFRKK